MRPACCSREAGDNELIEFGAEAAACCLVGVCCAMAVDRLKSGGLRIRLVQMVHKVGVFGYLRFRTNEGGRFSRPNGRLLAYGSLLETCADSPYIENMRVK